LGPRARVGGVIVAVTMVAGLLAPMLAPYNPDALEFASILAPPGASHLFGTDDLGRDVFSRVLFGARASFMVSLASVFIAFLTGTMAGIAAGYYGGWIDEALMAVANAILGFPGILIGLALAATAGPRLENALIAIAIVDIPVFARLARSQALVVRELGYVMADRAVGLGHFHILTRTMAPNIVSPLIVQASLLVASAVIMESYLSFLGLSAQPPTPTLGSMLRQAMGFLDQAPWLAWFPGVAIFLGVLGFNLLGDGLRDYLDPQQR
jgi:peptide/nickel transport system permease protein